MSAATLYIEGLQRAADRAQSAESAYRQEAAARIKILERERAFAFRRMNLMRSIAETVRAKVEDNTGAEERTGEEIAVAGALALLRVKLGWSSDSEMQDATLAKFTPVTVALYRAFSSEHQETPNPSPDISETLIRFEDWYEEAYGISFWMLFENPIPDTPRVDF
ncbi:MAG: hypothetical protein AAAC48_27645 [Phyllobacterium sp.]|uniref:hypothetical protein n=1 Tax=Phyllobacterium sp. TaxID=1871046 RepID=UPI0030EFE241